MLVVCGATAHAADKVTVQLKWLPQAQFAGYYVAQSKGYYKAEGLDVEIDQGEGSAAPVGKVATGAYTGGVKFRADANYKTYTGTLKSSGASVKLVAFGYLNSNNSGAANQNLIFDSLQFNNCAAIGNSTNA